MERDVYNIGSQHWMRVHVGPVDGCHLDEMNAVCFFYVYLDEEVKIEKSKMKRIDEDNYRAFLDTKGLSPGRVMCRIELDIPDADSETGWRREIKTEFTDLELE